MWFTTVAVILFPAYFFFDVNHFIRSALTILFAKTRRKIDFLDPSTIHGLVIPSDVDFLLSHMNNGRYLREMDFARLDHGTRSGFFAEAMRRGGMVLLSSSFIRYRLPLPIFSRYQIVTNVVWWDDKNVYLTHKVITTKDNIARAVIYARATCVRCSVSDVLDTISPGSQKPETIAPDYKKWMETLELSSQLMKASCAATVGGGGNGCIPQEIHQENGKNGGILSGAPLISDHCAEKEFTSLHQD